MSSTPAEKSTASPGQDYGPPAKKITLNRKVLSQQTTPATSENSENGKKIEEVDTEKKVVKLTEISMKEVTCFFVNISIFIIDSVFFELNSSLCVF